MEPTNGQTRPDRAPSDRGGRTGRTPRERAARVVGLLIALVVILASVVVVSVVTDRPAFCTTCHEMQPYYAAWMAGKHHGVSCVDCHVDAGVVAGFAHKFVALREVWDHFFTQPRFPTGSVSTPDSRCLPCHRTIPVRPGSRFSHVVHAGKALCAQCHKTTGHDVSDAALQAAGLLAAFVPTSGGTSASGAHVQVTCFQCHKPATPCALCHTPPHEQRGPCEKCHPPGPTWNFAHPPTAQHSYLSFPCVKCHPHGFTTASCTGCHGPQGPGD